MASNAKSASAVSNRMDTLSNFGTSGSDLGTGLAMQGGAFEIVGTGGVDIAERQVSDAFIT